MLPSEEREKWGVAELFGAPLGSVTAMAALEDVVPEKQAEDRRREEQLTFCLAFCLAFCWQGGHGGGKG